MCLLAAEQLALLDGFERGYERVRATALLHAAPPAELAAAPGYDAARNALTVDVYVSTAPEWMGPPSEMYCTAIAGMLREVRSEKTHARMRTRRHARARTRAQRRTRAQGRTHTHAREHTRPYRETHTLICRLTRACACA